MLEPIGVDAQFLPDGEVRIQRILRAGHWLTVGQGRQWVDGSGRHVLVMTADDTILELLLQADTMAWVIKPRAGTTHLA